MNKKKIISLRTFHFKKKNYIKKFKKNSKLHKLARKVYVESDKHNFSYFFSWKGEPFLQTPEDIITLQEIIYELKPEVIIEVGVAWGGTILFYDSLSKEKILKKIIGIDIFMPKDLKKRIYKKLINKNKVHLFEEDSVSDHLYKKIKLLIKNNKRILVHLDSNHTHEHVLKELNFYDLFLKKNDMIIVGDTIINYIPEQKHRIREWNKKNNPKTALDFFLKNNKNYKIDKSVCDKKLFTNNVNGYIKKF